MAAKCIVLLFLVAVASVQAVTEIRLPDETTSHLSNPFIPKSIGIGVSIFDKLVACNIIYPNGAMYEVFPTWDLPRSDFIQDHNGGVFDACSLAFVNAPSEYSGTYEMLSLVTHALDGSMSLTMKKFHLEFYYSDSWLTPSKKAEILNKVNN